MTISDWKKKYANGIPITLLAAHDATFAQIIEDVGIDGILVGDSLRHTFFGDSTTVTMTLDHMIYHKKQVGASCMFYAAVPTSTTSRDRRNGPTLQASA